MRTLLDVLMFIGVLALTTAACVLVAFLLIGFGGTVIMLIEMLRAR